MNSRSLALSAAALLCAPALSSAAAIVGINFNNSDGAGSQNDGNFGATWTNLNPATGSQAVNGTPSATVNWSTSNYWQAGSWMSSTLGNAFNTPIGLMRVYLDDGDNPAAGSPAALGSVNGDGIGASASVSGLTAWLASNGASAYTVRAFFSTDNGTSFRDISVRNGPSVSSPVLATMTPTVQGNGQWNGTAVDSGGNDSGGIRGDATFAQLFNQDTITLTVLSNGGTSRGTLAGFVIAAVPEPSTSLLGGLTLGLLLRRRR